MDGLEFVEVVSVTRLHAGIADNVIPGEATATLNLRYPPDRDPAEAEAYLAALVPDGATLEIVSNAAPGRVVVDTPAVRALQAAGGLAIKPKQAWTNVADFTARGLDAVNFGPGHTAFAHHRDEQRRDRRARGRLRDPPTLPREPDGRRCAVMDLAERIDGLWESSELEADPIEEAIARLDSGEVRVAERAETGWIVNEWVKKAILLYFRLRKVEPMEVGGLHFLDKIPVKADYADRGVRVVPPGVARYGAFLSEGVVLMPGFVNIGAWVGPRTMVDTWATVGSCAQIGADVHLSGGVGIGGVLEPPQARPVIVEDGAFLGSRAVVVEGVVVGEGAVIAPNVVLSASIPVIDVTGSEPVEHRGYVPPRSVVLPGTRPKEYPAGSYDLPCALIVGSRSASTDLKTSLNDVLREFEIAT